MEGAMHRAERRGEAPSREGRRRKGADENLHGDRWKGEGREAGMRDTSQGRQALAGERCCKGALI